MVLKASVAILVLVINLYGAISYSMYGALSMFVYVHTYIFITCSRIRGVDKSLGGGAKEMRELK